MKKYFLIAALLGVIAFGSVSYLAQAEEKSSPVAESKAVAADRMVAPTAPPVVDPSDGEAEVDNAAAADTFEADRAECDIAAAKPREEGGAAPSDADKAKAFTKCMGDKGHAEDEIKAKASDAKPDAGDVKDHGEAVEE